MLEVTPEIKMVAGQATYLKGDYHKALDYLKVANTAQEIKPEVVPWLAATYKSLGEENQAAPDIK